MEAAIEVESLKKENAALRAEVATARKFYSLAAVWKTLTLHISDVTEKCSHPAYLQIIAMGPDALPFIFDELEREPDSWFVALGALTGTNPVPVNSRCNFKETVNAWLRWAQENGYYRGAAVEN